MTTLVAPRIEPKSWALPAWTPLVLLPPLALGLTTSSPAWVQMWALAVAVYASFKWLTYTSSAASAQAPWTATAGYLLMWPGMDADAFLARSRREAVPHWNEWCWACVKLLAGIAILSQVSNSFAETHPLIGGWLTMIGCALVLHFGLFHLISLQWRTGGVNAPPLMNRPLLATSLSDFWRCRWNLAFRDAAYRFVFRPLLKPVGGRGALMAVFVVSGLIHDAVISLAARGGFGLPSLYFLIQGAAVLFERGRWGRAVGLGRGLLGRVYAWLVVLAPAGLLFHTPFLTRVVVPMLQAIHEVTK